MNPVAEIKRIRKELERNEWHGYSVGQFVTDTRTGRLARIVRFVDCGGVPNADIRYWYDRPSAVRKLMVQVELLPNLEPADDPRIQDED